MSTQDVLLEIHRERARQEEKWGEQHHPNGTGSSYRVVAEEWKRLNDEAAIAGSLTWEGILLEEVFEALSEADHGPLEVELTQVAAVAAAWIEDLRGQDGQEETQES